MRSVTTREVEWDDDQQALILALALYRREHCDQCGGYLPETTDKANEYGYEAVGPFMCHSCEAMGKARDESVKAHEKNPIHNMSRWSIRLRKG